MIACESQWDRENASERRHLKHDFEKLLSASCPLKVFLCWADEMTAHAIREDLQTYAATEVGVFQRGSAAVLYCIDPHTTTKTPNKDLVWLFQADGEFTMPAEVFQLPPIT